MTELIVRSIYKRYDKQMKRMGSLDVGGSHHLTCQSMVNIFTIIQDLYKLEDIKTMDVGAGAGYFVFLSHQLGAQSFGIEYENQHMLLIPHELYNLNIPYKFINTDFSKTYIQHYTSYDIIFLIIGKIQYIISLFELFKNHSKMKAFVFLKPCKDFKTIWSNMKDYCNLHQWIYYIVKVHIAVSHEQREIIIIRKSTKVSFVDLSSPKKRVRFCI